MGSTSLELRMLRKIKTKFTKDPSVIYNGYPPGLEPVYGDLAGLNDPYHVKLQVKSLYCASEDLKAHVAFCHPDMDLSTWTYSSSGNPGSGVNVTDKNSRQITIPGPVYESLKTEHIDTVAFEDQIYSWSLDLPYYCRDWLSDILPGYVDEDLIKQIAAARIQYAKKDSPDERHDRIARAAYDASMKPDIIGFLADGLAEAKANRCALYACLVN